MRNIFYLVLCILYNIILYKQFPLFLNMEKPRVGIIGSGPAGIFAAEELAQQEGLEITIFEKQKRSTGGMINDCKLNLTPRIGMDTKILGITDEEAQELIGYVDQQFLAHGAPSDVFGTDDERIQRLAAKAQRCGLELIPAVQRHVGTDNSKALVDSFKQSLVDKGVQFKTGHSVEKILPAEEGGFSLTVKHQDAEESVKVDYLVVAPGRAGSEWFRGQAESLGIEYTLGPIDIGIRLELPKEFYDELTDVIYDPKLLMDADDAELTRTFCTNPGGRIRIEPYKEHGHYLINGDATAKKKTPNTNFAILTRLYLTEPIVNTREEGMEMARRVNRFGGGRPIIQRVGDFMSRRRSRVNDFEPTASQGGIVYVEPTLSLDRVTPGDIRLAYSGKIVDKLEEMIIRLDKLVSGGGILNPGNILYAPEMKLYETRYTTDSTMETSVPNIFVAGDGVGKSRGIIGAGLTGILAARGLLAKI
jgi:hypothetical protein